jgi:hypothetical protein
MIPDRLKKIIFRKLYDDLSHVEIIPFNNSIWFVDRDEKYWYFELQSDGTLWWRYQFFSDFFILFSLERDDYQSILARWVEEVLNSRVYTTRIRDGYGYAGVEEVLNSRVIKTYKLDIDSFTRVEDVLNSKVNTTVAMNFRQEPTVEEVLNSRVLRTQVALHSTSVMAEGVLNCGDSAPTFDERLSHKVSQAKEGELFDETIVDTVLSSLRSF